MTSLETLGSIDDRFDAMTRGLQPLGEQRLSQEAVPERPFGYDYMTKIQIDDLPERTLATDGTINYPNGEDAD